MWTGIIVASFALGVLTGFAVFFLCRTQPLQAWLVFVGFVVFGLVVFALLVGSSSIVTSTFASLGDLTFLAGSLLIPLYVFWNLRTASPALQGDAR